MKWQESPVDILYFKINACDVIENLCARESLLFDSFQEVKEWTKTMRFREGSNMILIIQDDKLLFTVKDVGNDQRIIHGHGHFGIESYVAVGKCI